MPTIDETTPKRSEKVTKRAAGMEMMETLNSQDLLKLKRALKRRLDFVLNAKTFSFSG